MRKSLVDLHVGQAFGRYELLVPIAQGGMSRVWAGRLRGTRGFQRVVAVKTLCAEGPDHDRLEQMLLAEARLAAQLQHPNVAQYQDLGERDGVLYVVMEWVDGESLTTVLKSLPHPRKIPIPIAAQVVAQACNGLHGAHELSDASGTPLGLVHCDVSPHNLMISASGATKLIDFGIAKATHGAPMDGQDSMVAGKLAFMAPEQARGERVDRRADIFSLGIVLYLLTTGRHPFGFGSPMETLQRIVRNAPVIPPCAADPHYPPALERVVMRALAHKREDRFETAADMLYELSAATELAHELEVGAFVQELCGDSLRARRAQITAALELAAARDDGASTPALLGSVPPAAAALAPPTAELAILQHGSTNAPAATDLSLSELPRPKSRGRRLALPLVLLGAALGVIAYQVRPDSLPTLGGGPAPAAQSPPAAPLVQDVLPKAEVAARQAEAVPAVAEPQANSAGTSATAGKSEPASLGAKKARRSSRCRPGSPCVAPKPAATAVKPAAGKAPKASTPDYGI